MKICELEPLQSLLAGLEFLDNKNDLMRCAVRSKRRTNKRRQIMRLTKQKVLRIRKRRALKCFSLIVAAIFLVLPISAHAQDNSQFHEIETKYIFGTFTVGSSTGIEGEKAFEPETQASFGKRGGRYATSATALEYEYTPTQYMQLIFGPIVSYHNIHDVPDLDDRNIATVSGFEAEFRSVLIDRGPSPFAVTLALEPEFRSRDETSGAKVVNYALEVKLQADAELIKNRLYLGFNLLYEPETTRGDLGVWSRESTAGISSALAWQIIPNVVIGADLWYLRHYDGAAFNSFTGDAVYLGPTFYWKIAPKMLISAAWQAQIAGRESGVVGALDLSDFSRYRARLLLEFEF